MWRIVSRLISNIKINKLNNDLLLNIKRTCIIPECYTPPFKMNNLKPAPNSRKKAKRKGRGAGSQLGRQAGRGTRAVNEKRTNFCPQYEGGASPFYAFFRYFPRIKKSYEENLVGINIGVLVMLIKQGRLDPNKPITIFELINNRIISDPKDGIKILGRGYDLYDLKLTIEATKASKYAIEAIEKNGGTFKSVYIDPEILKCWADFKIVKNQIETAYDPKTKVPYKINQIVLEKMLHLQKLSGTHLAPSLPPPEIIHYYLSSGYNGFLSKKVINNNK